MLESTEVGQIRRLGLAFAEGLWLRKERRRGRSYGGVEAAPILSLDPVMTLLRSSVTSGITADCGNRMVALFFKVCISMYLLTINPYDGVVKTSEAIRGYVVLMRNPLLRFIRFDSYSVLAAIP